MSPEKLLQFSENKLIPSATDEYLRHIIKEEMPRGLKQYMEYELFPRIQLKVSRGISLSTARRWMCQEGFRYISHKKGLYFDGHDRPDVVHYTVGDVDTELAIQPQNYMERRLVICAQDKMTAQANDSQGKSWVLD